MIKRKPISRGAGCGYFSRRLIFAASLLLFAAPAIRAMPLTDYQKQIQQASTALDTLAQINETEDAPAYEARSAETVDGVRRLLPKTEAVEWNGTTFNVDNSWLHQDLDKYKTIKGSERTTLRTRISERLRAIDERLTELQAPGPLNAGKAEESRKLAEILRRPEYARQVKKESALTRVIQDIIKWLQSLFPKPKPVSPGTGMAFSKIAQVVVIVLALAVLAFVLKLFLPRMIRSRGRKKQGKVRPRIVLGERLEPDESATDLLSEADLLARRGELRAAIRKGYIALLVELGERKIISLAQYKTNRDYLRAVREVEPLYGNVKQLTDSFERHWYGFARATETDWLAFRAAYEQALLR
ncbi:MAG TPA: hypothetical protein DHU55_02980 [Blastocatellia bacterium]|nr:hypothetical protein [Blastocatellia bacterium]